jgi:hypothetical protein
MNDNGFSLSQAKTQIGLHQFDRWRSPTAAQGMDGVWVDISSDDRWPQMLAEWKRDACQHPRKIIYHWQDGGYCDRYSYCCFDCGARASQNLKHSEAQSAGVAVDFTEERRVKASEEYERLRKAYYDKISFAAIERVQSAVPPVCARIAEIKAIETHYRGHRFRSRLEARWAVYFDALGLIWNYEQEGYDLGRAGRYLPDFFLPDLGGGTWAEVKPDGVDYRHPDAVKWQALSAGTSFDFLLLDGPPSLKAYQAINDGDWTEVSFNSKYLPPFNHDGAPRLYWVPGGEEDCDTEDAVYAARSARFEHNKASA